MPKIWDDKHAVAAKVEVGEDLAYVIQHHIGRLIYTDNKKVNKAWAAAFDALFTVEEELEKCST